MLGIDSRGVSRTSSVTCKDLQTGTQPNNRLTDETT
ncbi:Uncharacterised protein [Mycobacteroides abscessus subsp. abscessus]|nr:Uncharacterised protein [Mycobacteroides abscessus subsp. abscessus]